MEKRDLKLVSSNANFFNRLQSSIRNMLLPTKIGFNNFKLNSKRNKYIKAEINYDKAKNSNDINKRQDAEENQKRAYSEYLEAIDKYMMDTIYEKAKNNKANDIEKKSLTEYYRISTYKDEQYDEYKYKKQLFLLTLDYNIQKNKNNGKINPTFEEIYTHKATNVYRSLFKNYSGRLVDNTSKNIVVKNNVYLEIFRVLDKYVTEILPLEIKYSKTNQYTSILLPYDAYKSYIGKLNERENLEKKILLIKLSRTLFTHSLPLPTIEQCYEKLLKDTRILLLRKEGTKKEDRIFGMIRLIIEDYNENILSTKIYWNDKEEKKANKEFWDTYKKAKTDDEKDKQICLNEIAKLEKEVFPTQKEEKLRKYYIKRLKNKYGVKLISGYKKFQTQKTYTRYIEELNIV